MGIFKKDAKGRCPFCKEKVRENDLYCISCGKYIGAVPELNLEQKDSIVFDSQDVNISSEPVKASYCPKCGNNYENGDLFCMACGNDYRKNPPIPLEEDILIDPVFYCANCNSVRVSAEGMLCDTCRKKIEEPIFYCADCNSVRVSAEGMLCDACRRKREELSEARRNPEVLELGNGEFKPIE